jgi:hypothetical protein
MAGSRYSCQNLMKLEFSWRFFRKIVLNFLKIRLVGGLVKCGRTDGQT